jgi:GNAT superfamily N-acetyltransferase
MRHEDLKIEVRDIQAADAERLAAAFAGTPWRRPAAHFDGLAVEHAAGSRVVLVGVLSHAIAGYGSLVWSSAYPPFRDAGVPEIQDLNVSPGFRRQGVATRILEEAERRASERGGAVGIAVGLHPGYRAAQRLYGLRGYVPDGHGVFQAGRFPGEGEQVVLDDELVLHLIKPLDGAHAA